jgi:DNA-binding SARP family transcriptional activator
MDLRVLGPLTLDGGRIEPAPRDRLVLGALAARLDKAVAVESLATAVWGEELPASWTKIVPGCIMRLRRTIAPAKIETTPVGYRLAAADIDLDAEEFERLVRRGVQLLELGEPDRAVHVFTEALELWRGQPFAELADWEPAQVATCRLEELRLAAEESLLEARLQSGDLVDAASEARARVAEAPLRERRWVILGLAQYRQGRQAEALATARRGRELLASEFGLDPCVELAALERAILAQDPALQSGVAFRAASAECPYFGLRAAGLEDDERFFGREAELVQGLRTLERSGVLVVSGSSGVGKSSFVRAGIGAHVTGRGRRVTVITPGERPLQTLRDVDHDGESLLIVDQCEQAFLADEHDARAFFAELRLLVFRGAVVLSVRADRLGDLADHHGFADIIQSNLLMLGPLAEEGLRAVIEKPARHAGLILEPGLVEVLIRDADGRNLPLLSHALRQVWRRREGRVMSVDAYRASGEIHGAVAHTAESMFAALPEEDQSRVRDILLRLVEPSRGGGVICQRVDRASVAVDAAHSGVLDHLVDARLVTSDAESYQLAHEAVAREWPRLREWLADDVEGQRVLRHLASTAQAWDAMGRPDSELYRGVRLSAAVQWRGSAGPVLAPVEAEFLDASVRAEAAAADEMVRQLTREQRSVRRLRWLVGVAASLAVVALTAGTVAGFQASEANARVITEDARRVVALAAAEPEFERALLLSVEAIRLWDASETRTALLDVLRRSPRVVGVTRTFAHRGVQQMSLAPGSANAVIVDDSEFAQVLDIDRRGLVAAFQVPGSLVLDATEAPGGLTAMSVLGPDCVATGACESAFLRILDLTGGATEGVDFSPFDAEVIDIEFSPDGSLMAVIAALPWVDDPGNVMIWRVDAPTRPLALDLPYPGTNPGAPNASNAFGRVRFSPDGSRLYASGFGTTAIFDTTSGALVGELDGEGILAVSPDGRHVLVRDGRTAAQVVDLSGIVPSRDLEVPDVMLDGAFSPDGRQVVTIGGDRAWVWNTASGDLSDILEGHTDTVSSLAFRSNGDLVTAGRDGAVISWHMGDWSAGFRESERKGKELGMPRDERTLLVDVPDGTIVAIGADPSVWLDRACAIAGRGLTEDEWQELFAGRPYDPACAGSTP